MSDPSATREFLARLAVDRRDGDVFTGTCHPAWPGRAFGGQVLAKALCAAAATAPEGAMQTVSVHAYFHAPVAAGREALYAVERVKDGRTFATRRVSVMQDDRLLVTVMVLLGEAGNGPDHQMPVPVVPSPEALTAEERLIPEVVLPRDADFEGLGYPADGRVDLRVIDEGPSAAGTRRPTWMRVTVELPEDPLTGAALLCYLSDITLGTTALEPHGGREATIDMQLGAVELSLWFINPAPTREWMLFDFASPAATRGRALAHGVIYDADGDALAVAVQNALMRHA